LAVQNPANRHNALVALVVAVVVFRTAWGMLRGVLHTLGDAARLPADKVAVAACVVPDVVSCHGVRTRGSKNQVYVGLHVQVTPGTTVERGHEITHEVEDSLRPTYGQITDVVVHLEPVSAREPGAGPHQ